MTQDYTACDLCNSRCRRSPDMLCGECRQKRVRASGCPKCVVCDRPTPVGVAGRCVPCRREYGVDAIVASCQRCGRGVPAYRTLCRRCRGGEG